MLYPLTFQPIFKERIWGGRKLQELYAKALPPKLVIGESWEICDRSGDVNVITNGPLAGKDLHWLMKNHGQDLLGNGPVPPRFPLLIKIIDAQEKLSLQVHPPASLAASLGGEPKTEMWYIADAIPGAELYVGLKPGVTRAEFEKCIADQTVAECFHRIPVKRGDAMFLPSGRVHALGAGIMIFEVQQNSDTTYRVFDWNRVDASGKPRELHVEQSLASIDFNDFEPKLLPSEYSRASAGSIRPLVANDLFNVSLRKFAHDQDVIFHGGQLEIIGVLEGDLVIASDAGDVELRPGQFCLLPASLGRTTAKARSHLTFTEIHAGAYRS